VAIIDKISHQTHFTNHVRVGCHRILVPVDSEDSNGIDVSHPLYTEALSDVLPEGTHLLGKVLVLGEPALGHIDDLVT